MNLLTKKDIYKVVTKEIYKSENAPIGSAPYFPYFVVCVELGEYSLCMRYFMLSPLV